MRENRVQEILDTLDIDCYGKGCNYIEEDNLINGMPSFYSRDYCYNISFKDLIKWYIGKLGKFDWEDFWEENRTPTEEELRLHNESSEKQLELFMELIDIYSVYRVMSKLT